MVDNVTSMDLILEEGAGEQSLAAQLVMKKYAVHDEESYCSKEDHAERKNAADAIAYGSNFFTM